MMLRDDVTRDVTIEDFRDPGPLGGLGRPFLDLLQIVIRERGVFL